ncbi:MAG: tRNA (adenosine(37)-N6)-threonylcarbamoyltransferase complex transferase subunit TsaD [Candidatus Moranbacteria bacterium]|nr:tRNA (adenosine(37)-N6)-threonylcarbamoyltransferase complex transferase subunit TsaD [Candidatus Moranbacteria bacterium]
MSGTTTILSIETSCDETAAAVISYDDAGLTVLASVVSSQIELHAKYGGVVPNLAAREHIRNIIPVIEEALETAGVAEDDIDAIAVTQGPGLIPALLIGVSAAKTLALVWQKPLLGIHHIEGHIYANFIGVKSKLQITNAKRTDGDIFPLLALVVSGGHTQLVLMRDHFEYEILGETRDDAAGEAFDKVARILGLPYPGGPAIAARAANFQITNSKIQINSKSQIPKSRTTPSPFSLPRPMIDSDDLGFSFSGLKTAALYLVKENEARKTDEGFVNEVAHEFQDAVVDVLVAKTRKAIETYSPKTVIIAGGVSANEELRNQLRNSINILNLEVRPPSERVSFLVPEFKYSLDNAAMIGAAAAVRFVRLSSEEREQLKSNSLSLDPNANLPLR